MLMFFSVNKANPAYMGPIRKIKTLMFTYNRLVIAVLSTIIVLTRQTHFNGWTSQLTPW